MILERFLSTQLNQWCISKDYKEVLSKSRTKTDYEAVSDVLRCAAVPEGSLMTKQNIPSRHCRTVPYSVLASALAYLFFKDLSVFS